MHHIACCMHHMPRAHAAPCWHAHLTHMLVNFTAPLLLACWLRTHGSFPHSV